MNGPAKKVRDIIAVTGDEDMVEAIIDAINRRIRGIKKNRGAMFITLAKDYDRKNNINLNFR